MLNLCPRCYTTLAPADGVDPAFCPVCGLPQLRVPEEMLEPVAAPAARTALPVGGVEWTVAFRVLFFAGLIGVVPSLIRPEVVVGGGGGILALLLLPLLVLGSGAAYLRRRPYPAFTAGMGARMGVVLALFVSGALAVASGVAGFILRYGMHSRLVQTNLDAAFQEFAARMNASGTPLPPEWATVMHWPEVRAGAFLFSNLLTTALLLLVGAVAGAIAGALLGGQQRRSQR